MKGRFIAFLFLILVSVSILALASCSSGTDLDKARVGKASQQEATVTFPETTFIDDREVRFTVRTITYPQALPTLSAKTEGFSDDETVGWFTADGGKAEPKTEDLRHSPDLELASVPDEQPSSAQPTQEMWEITGEETGTLVLENDGGIMFANPKEYRSYGVLPKGNILNRDVKIIFARDMITDEDAISGVETYVESHGGIPTDARRKIIPGMSGLRIVTDGEMVKPVDKSLWYTVTYNHRFERIPIEPDKIELVIDALGVARYARAWHTIIGSSSPREIISPERAVGAVVKRFGYKMWPRKGLEINQVRLAYQTQAVETKPDDDGVTEFRPVWLIRFVGQDFIVDALTGEAIGQPEDSVEERKLATAKKEFEGNPLSDKIPVPVRITFIDSGQEAWWVSPTDAEFGPLFLEAQKILSKMRPYYKKQADQHGASGDTPQTRTEGGLRLDYDGNARFVTNSKVGRDFDEKSWPKDEKERQLYYSKDGYYRIYAQNIFISFSRSALSPTKKLDVRSNTQPTQPHASGGEPRTKILASTTGPKYLFTYALASDDKLIEMTHEQSADYIKMLSRSSP